MDCEGKVITSDNSWGFSTRRNCQSSSKELLSPPAGRAVSSPADPVSLAVSPCIHLGAQSVSGRGIKKKKYLCKKYLRWLPRKLFLFTGNGQLFVSWVWFWLAPAGLGCSHWVQDGGSLWAVSFSQNHQLPCLSFEDCSIYFYWNFPLVGSQRSITTSMQRLQVPSHLQPAWHMVNRRGMRAREHNFDVQDCESVPRCFWMSLWRQASRCLSYPAL